MVFLIFFNLIKNNFFFGWLVIIGIIEWLNIKFSGIIEFFWILKIIERVYGIYVLVKLFIVRIF